MKALPAHWTACSSKPTTPANRSTTCKAKPTHCAANWAALWPSWSKAAPSWPKPRTRQPLRPRRWHNKQLLDELDAEAQALDTQRQQAEAAATQAEQAAQALQARQDELTQTQIQLEQALQQASTELDSQQAAAEAQAAVTEEKRKAYEQATAALDAYLKAQSQKYQDPARHCSLDFTCPLPSVGRISTYFGEPDAVYNKPHTGADMPAASGTLIYAVADGVVSAASARPSYGNCVQIDHGTADDGSSYATLYAHMSSFCVSAGQTVHKGDVIGYVGNTGDVRGANGGYHLHLELRINGTRTDPLQYIPH